jgi:hypothetical protein
MSAMALMVRPVSPRVGFIAVCGGGVSGVAIYVFIYFVVFLFLFRRAVPIALPAQHPARHACAGIKQPRCQSGHWFLQIYNIYSYKLFYEGCGPNPLKLALSGACRNLGKLVLFRHHRRQNEARHGRDVEFFTRRE